MRLRRRPSSAYSSPCHAVIEIAHGGREGGSGRCPRLAAQRSSLGVPLRAGSTRAIHLHTHREQRNLHQQWDLAIRAEQIARWERTHWPPCDHRVHRAALRAHVYIRSCTCWTSRSCQSLCQGLQLVRLALKNLLELHRSWTPSDSTLCTILCGSGTVARRGDLNATLGLTDQRSLQERPIRFGCTVQAHCHWEWA